MTIRNATPQATNIHYHGMHVSPKRDHDNVFRTMAPGTTVRSTVTLPRDHAPGTYWYHAHLHPLTEPQVMGGMSGLIVVEGLERLLPRALRGVPQRQIAIRDLQVDPDAPGQVALSSNEIGLRRPTVRLVNGLLTPQAGLRQGETQLWRLANISADVFYDVELTGHAFTVIAEDGAPRWRVRTVDHLVMPPGKRYDVLVTGGAPGRHRLRTRAYPQEGFELLPEAELMTVDVTPGTAAPAPRVPRRLHTPARPVSGRRVARKRTFTFGFDLGHTEYALINGRPFDPSVTNAAPYVGTVEEWTLRNTTTEEHPFHIHVNDFEVVEVNGRPHRADGLQDVVTIPPRDASRRAGEVVIRIWFRRYTGHFVFHCHILAHEDHGMMNTVQVRRRGEPRTPPPGGHAHRPIGSASAAATPTATAATPTATATAAAAAVPAAGGAPGAATAGARETAAERWARLCRLRERAARLRLV